MFFINTSAVNIIDIIILICCVPAVINGFSKGFVSQAVSLISLILGAWLSFKFSVPVGDWLKNYADLPATMLHVIAFAMILVIVVLILKLIGSLLEKAVKFVMLGWLNKLLGMVFALIKALLVIGLVILLVDAVYNAIPFVSTKTLDESVLFHPIKDVANIVFPYIKELIFKK